jgi:phage-related protein
MEFFANRPNHEWIRPSFDKLKGGSCEGLHEIRIKAASGQYRVLGSFGAKRNEFTLYVAFHKKRDSDTKAACKIAQARKLEVIADGNRTKECQFP